jgi:hypothetical protein
MTISDTPQMPADEPAAAPGSKVPLWSRILIAIFIVASVLMWTYALWGPRSDPPGTMDDPAFGLAAEEICADHVARINQLPEAQETTVAEERAKVIDEANQLLALELAGLAELPTTSAEDERRVNDWLGDWKIYLGDRQTYAADLHLDDGARLLETELAGDHISQALEFFAQINAMPSCAPPGDVA